LDLDLFSEQLLFDLQALEFVNEDGKADFIRSYIIPQMNERSERKETMSGEEVKQKLHSKPNSEKPGEWAELCREIVDDKTSGLEKVVNVALELADIVYYCLQPNSSETLESVFMYLYLERFDLAYLFCIAKYCTRLEFGDDPKYKEIEKYIMKKYLTYIKYTFPRTWENLSD